MRWQDVSKILAGLSTVGVVGLFSYLFLLTGMEYTHSGDGDCSYVDGIYQCNATINITTKFWNFEFEHLKNDSYIYLPANLKDFTGKLIRYKAGDLDFVPAVYKKSTYGRKLWVNLDMIDNIIDTQPQIKVDWLVPARGKDNWRPVKEGDTWSRLKNNRIMLIGYPESEFETIKWSFVVGEIDIDPVWTRGARYEIRNKQIIGKDVIEIKFTNIQKEYKIKDEALKQGKNPKELLNIKKTKYYGDVELKLMHYVNVTTQNTYDCNCIDHIITSPNGTEITSTTCDTCHEDITTEVFQEINPNTFILKNNEPIYEVMEKSTKFEKIDEGWGYSVWTDVNIMGLEIEGATWWNSTFGCYVNFTVSDLPESYFQVNLNFDESDFESSCTIGSEKEIRFVNSSGSELDFWVENDSFSTSNNNSIWVEVTNNESISMYYGNTSEVSSVSSGDDTFLWFNDYDGADPYTGDTTRILGEITTYDDKSVYHLTANNGAYITLPSRTTVDIRNRVYNDDSTNNLWIFWMTAPYTSSSSDQGYACYSTSAVKKLYTNNNGLSQVATVTTTTPLNQWNTLQCNIENTDVDFEYITSGNTLQTENAVTYSNLDTWELMITAGAGNRYVDWTFHKKYSATTPTYSFGAEESDSAINYSTIDCRTLDSAYGYYWLDASITDSTTEKCMEITANHITLDCQGNTIDGDDSSGHYAIWINRNSQETTNITLKNCIVTDWAHAGIDIEYANYNNITNCTFNSNGVGVYMYLSDYNNFTDVTANSNDYDAIEMELSSHNVFSNNTYDSNSDTGIYLMYNSTDNIFANSTITNNDDYGIQIVEDPTEPDATNNTFYNNLFNNTDNFHIDNADYVGTAYLNTTNQTGTREYSTGTNIGGNFWAYPNGTGYSETCADFDEDDFCDTAYTLYSGAIDYLPYTNTEISDFDITESTGTLFYFYAYQPIQTEIEPYGQTSTVGMFTLDNNLTYIIDIYAKLNETTTGVTLKLNDEYDYDDAVAITDSYQLIYDDLAVSGTGYIWAWADFNNLQSQFDPKLEIVAVTH